MPPGAPTQRKYGARVTSLGRAVRTTYRAAPGLRPNLLALTLTLTHRIPWLSPQATAVLLNLLVELPTANLVKLLLEAMGETKSRPAASGEMSSSPG